MQIHSKRHQLTVQLRGQTSIEMLAHPKFQQRSVSVFPYKYINTITQIHKFKTSIEMSAHPNFDQRTISVFLQTCSDIFAYLAEIKLTVPLAFTCGHCIFCWVGGIFVLQFVHAIWCVCVCLGAGICKILRCCIIEGFFSRQRSESLQNRLLRHLDAFAFRFSFSGIFNLIRFCMSVLTKIYKILRCFIL